MWYRVVYHGEWVVSVRGPNRHAAYRTAQGQLSWYGAIDFTGITISEFDIVAIIA